MPNTYHYIDSLLLFLSVNTCQQAECWQQEQNQQKTIANQNQQAKQAVSVHVGRNTPGSPKPCNMACMVTNIKLCHCSASPHFMHNTIHISAQWRLNKISCCSHKPLWADFKCKVVMSTVLGFFLLETTQRVNCQKWAVNFLPGWWHAGKGCSQPCQSKQAKDWMLSFKG